MYPIPELDSQSMLNLQYPQDFSDNTFHHPVYTNTTRRPSIDVYGAAQDMSPTLDYPALHIPYDFSETPTHVHLHAPVPVPIIHPTYEENYSPSYGYEGGYEGSNSNYAKCPQLLSPASGAMNTATLDYYTNSPQLLFQTPSELLTNLSAATAPMSTGLPFTSVHPTRRVQSQSSGRSIDAPISPPRAVNKAESQRKARQRAIAEEIGFIPTDP